MNITGGGMRSFPEVDIEWENTADSTWIGTGHVDQLDVSFQDRQAEECAAAERHNTIRSCPGYVPTE
jgi:hypothetical protein